MEPVFILVIFSVGNPPPKKLTIPQMAAKLCPLNVFFFVWDNKLGLRIYHGNYLIMDNKHRKPFVIK